MFHQANFTENTRVFVTDVQTENEINILTDSLQKI